MSRRRVLLFVAALAVINVPFLWHEWQLQRAATDGVRVQAGVVQVIGSGGDAVVDFRLPRSVDPTGALRAARVDRNAAATATRTHRIGVRVLSGHPNVFRVDGEVRTWGGLAFTVAADLLIVLMLLVWWRFGGRLRRPPLEALALEDVESGGEDSLLAKQTDGTYVINGQVAEVGDASFVLTLRDRDVTVHLQGHHNPVSVGGRAQVRAHLVG